MDQTHSILQYSILHSVTYAGYHPQECHPQNPHTTHHPQHSQQVQMQSWARCTAAASSSSTPPPLGWSGNRRHEMLTHVQASLLHLRREDKRERHWGHEICKRALAHPKSVASSRRAELFSQNGDLALALRQGLAPADVGAQDVSSCKR